MIYIVYGLSGPLKRVLIDPIFEAGNENFLNISFNKRGIYGKQAKSYDTERELIFCERETDLAEECGDKYIYLYGDYTVAINHKELENKRNTDREKHIIICHDPDIIKDIKRDYPNTQIIKISITAPSVLAIACRLYNDDFLERAKKIARIIDAIENRDKIEPDIEIIENNYFGDYSAIGQNLSKKLISKLNSKWHYLLNSQRFEKEEAQDDSLAFEQDYNRVINTAAFRRLQDKAQVFPLEKNDYPRTRLTHSIECSAIAEELGSRALQIIKEHPDCLQSCYKIPTILKTAALLHDMGNPPFGHFGEDIIQHWFHKQFKLSEKESEVMRLKNKEKEDRIELYTSFTSNLHEQFKKISNKYKNDFIHFEGNAQLFRLITSLNNVKDNHRLNLTYATLAVILKYPTNSENISKDILSRKKPGYFTSEESVFKAVQENVHLDGKRHPLTFLLEAADDISYLTSDLQDAHHKKLISWQVVANEFNGIKEIADYIEKMQLIDDEKIRFEKFHAFLRKKLIKDVIEAFKKNYDLIMRGEFEKELIKESGSKEIEAIIREKFLEKYVYFDDSICRSQIMSNTILTKLLDVFIPAVLEYKLDKQSELNKRIFCLLSDNYKQVLEKVIEKSDSNSPEVIYHKILLATDYICGMTDSYAQQMYNMIVALPLNG